MNEDDPRPAYISKDEIGGFGTCHASTGTRAGAAISIIIAAIGILILIAGISTMESCASESPPASASAKALAYSAMQTFVKRRLKSPGTAQFPARGQSQHVDYIGDGQYQIESYVDAQNSFGAMRRLSFAGVVEKAGDDRYELQLLKVESD